MAALEARAVITAEDRTKAAFESIKARISALTQQAAAFDRIMGTAGGVAKSMEGVHAATGHTSEELSRLSTSARSMGSVAESVGHVERSFRSSTGAVAQFSQRLTEAETRMRAISRAAGSGRGGHASESLLGMGSLVVAHEAGQMFEHVVENYKEFDKERRYGKVVMGIDDAQQEPLVQQAIHGAASSRFNDIQWLESQRELAARGYNLDQVRAFTPIAAQIGQAFDVSMPEGVKALEGAMLGFKKDTTTYAAAMASAHRTADLQVKASKISGMSYEDIVHLYKYGAAPAQMSRLSEESLLAFGAISKKSNMGGDESGVAFRALTKNLLTPTAGARVAMRAAGIDFSSFQQAPKAMDAEGFYKTVAQNYGVKLNDAAKASLGKLFSDPKLLGDASEFMPAVVSALKGSLGKQDAKSLKSIAGLARNYRDASVGGVDTNGLMAALMTAMAKSPSLANAVFGSKQGGRIFAALGDPAFFKHMMDELLHESQGFAQKVSDARMEGFYANLQKLQNSLMNVDTAVGRAFDRDGSGGAMSDITGAAASFVQHVAELDPILLRAGTELAALAAGAAALKGFEFLAGGFGLREAARELVGAAGAIKVAESESMVPGVGRRAIGAGEGVAAGAAGAMAAEGAVAGEGAAAGAGAITAESVEVVAAGAASISVGTLAIAGVAAVALIDALSSGRKKHRASDDPGFGDKFPMPDTSALYPKNSIKAASSAGGRDEAPSQDKLRKAGHFVVGRGGVREWVSDDTRPRDWPLIVREPIDPFNPNGGALGGPRAAWPTKPFANPFFKTLPYDNPGRYEPIPPEPVHQPAFPHTPTPAPTVDIDSDPATRKIDELKQKLADLASNPIDPKVNPAGLEGLVAKLQQILGLQKEINAGGSGGGGRPGLGPSYPAAAPTGRMGGPR